ncbi:uncharacterized protein LOC126973570 [Leptidea sinapis]|uniref:uncharacterized protein LOC126973570 n=1 Tax=Leptidea sinapis TaxID=189913 RepID=UPI0021C30531|nr:uncharacterized protein LOC126973570 [Leptidea sinapis]
MSIGEIRYNAPPPPTYLIPPPPDPVTIVCHPPHLDFINFTIGQLHTQSIRLINVSKFEVRLSIKPPARRELDVQLCSRLVVTSGADAEIKIHFRPKDVRELRDELLIRVSLGKGIRVPIACFMQPPILEILIPNMGSNKMDFSQISVKSNIVDLGAKLLGDVHRTPVFFHCAESHASFFLLSDDAWINCYVEMIEANADGTVSNGTASDCFWVSPARWRGGGSTRGQITCRAPSPELHVTELRILSSTAIIRRLNIIADAVMFSPSYISIQAHEKDYDICSEDDPACESYVHLGTAFPERALSGNVVIINHSPLTFQYYWSIRPWGVCSCWTASDTTLYAEDDTCDAAKIARDMSMKGEYPKNVDAKAVYVDSSSGSLQPRSTTQVLVRVDNVGAVGIHRAVLMLILKQIPKESFPKDYSPMIVKNEEITEDKIPGVCASWKREVSEIVCGQLEVWWEVVPVRFVLDPPVVNLLHSRRLKETKIDLKLIQLCGVTGIDTKLVSPLESRLLRLLPGDSIAARVKLTLPSLPNEYPERDVIDHQRCITIIAHFTTII